MKIYKICIYSLFGMLLDDWRERIDLSGPVVGSFLQFAFQNNLFHFLANGKLSNFRVCTFVEI